MQDRPERGECKESNFKIISNAIVKVQIKFWRQSKQILEQVVSPDVYI
jgi:hypothetical protein